MSALQNVFGRGLTGLAVAPLLVLVQPAPASACSCGGSPFVCNGMTDLATVGHTAVFVGMVVSIATVHGAIGSPGQKNSVILERRVRLRIDEAFTRLSGTEIQVTTNGMSAMCGYDFREGQRYLVYATGSASDPSLQVSLCSRTRPLAEASDDVELLRGFARGRAQRRIFGAVHIARAAGGASTAPRGLKIVASRDGRRYETVTDALGQFRFRRLPAGQYSIRAWLNDSFSKKALLEPVLSNEQACAEVSFVFRPGARIAGTLTDVAGRPVEGTTVVIKDITPFELRPVQGPDSYSGTSNARGRFEIDGVLAGAYVIGILPRTRTRERPSVSYVTVAARLDRPKASQTTTLLGLSRDQNLEDVKLQLPDIALADLEVSVVRADGSPAERVRLEVQDPSGWVLERFSPSDGNLVLKLFVGQTYRIRAYNIRHDVDEGKQSESATVTIRQENEPVTIRLERPAATPSMLRRASSRL